MVFYSLVLIRSMRSHVDKEFYFYTKTLEEKNFMNLLLESPRDNDNYLILKNRQKKTIIKFHHNARN